MVFTVENFNINEIWTVFLNNIEKTLDKGLCEMWIKPMKLLSFNDNVLKIELPSEVWLDVVQNRFKNDILQAFSPIINSNFSIDYTVLQKEDLPPALPPVMTTEQYTKPNYSSNSTLNPDYTFEEFIEGPSNRFAYKASQVVVKNLGNRANNPFVMFSAPGLGKTHLLHAIGNQILKQNPNAKVIYVAAESFVSEFVEAIGTKSVENFRKKYRSLDCLLIDDIQYILGKDKSEQEFFYTFNTLFDNGKQIVLTSDRTPNQLGISERISTRLLSSIVADIKRPELETKLAFLRKKRDSNQFDITDDVLAFIADGIKGSIRELEGCLYRLTTYCNIHGVNATIPIAKEVLADILISENEKYAVSINQIKKVVCKYFKVNIEDLNSKKKNSSIAWPRQVSMYLATELTTLSLPEIGREFNRDHSTVIHAKEKVKEEIENNLLFAPIINDLINKVKTVDNF